MSFSWVLCRLQIPSCFYPSQSNDETGGAAHGFFLKNFSKKFSACLPKRMVQTVVVAKGEKTVSPAFADAKGGEYMKPHSHEEHIQHSFDAFCKKVLRNEARDYQNALARKETERSIFPNCPSKYWNSSLSVIPISRIAAHLKSSVIRFVSTMKRWRKQSPLCLLTAEILSCCLTSSICPTLKLQMC